MNTENFHLHSTLSEEEIDEIIIAEADNNSAWEPPIEVKKQPTSLSIPAELAARATFLANLHQEKNVEAWLIHLIQEEIERKEKEFLRQSQHH